MIDVECIFCGAILKAPESAIGKTGKCSKCFKQIKIFEKEPRPKDVSPPIEPASKTEHFCNNCGSPSKEACFFCSTCWNSFTQNEKSKDRMVRSSSAWENLNDRFDSKVRDTFDKTFKDRDAKFYLRASSLLILILYILFALISSNQITFREVSNNTVEMRVPPGTSRQKAIEAMLTTIYYHAESNPDQSSLTVKWVMPKDGLVDRYGNPLKEDIQMGIFENWNFNRFTEVRKYQSITYFLRTMSEGAVGKILDEHISDHFDGAHLLED